jgi:hypothetical protein
MSATPVQPNRVHDFFASLLATLVSGTFSWPGIAVHFALTSFSGWSLHSPYWLAGILVGVAWLLALLWIATVVCKRNERTAAGLFLLALLMGALGFVSGFTTR